MENCIYMKYIQNERKIYAQNSYEMYYNFVMYNVYSLAKQ